ncbi:MAG: GntR family transcriptional regulator, partial [Boseongicola sp. SB0670_bin_30]|nr:GntR family transcriptional regulator [Boseongicola sp. SB0670_bin_30]
MQTKPDFIDRDDAVTALRAFIATGSFRPGDRLPPERE